MSRGGLRRVGIAFDAARRVEDIVTVWVGKYLGGGGGLQLCNVRNGRARWMGEDVMGEVFLGGGGDRLCDVERDYIGGWHHTIASNVNSALPA